jgi:hypothetical protein
VTSSASSSQQVSAVPAVLPAGPMNREQVIQQYFLEHRAKLLDIAAFLDRIDRATAASTQIDFRDAAFRQAVKLLTDGQPQRTKRILELLSDFSSDLPQSAHGMKGASGAVRT